MPFIPGIFSQLKDFNDSVSALREPDKHMPLQFQTVSHGIIAVGFFNIETDMILMNHYFVFASDFCDWITEWADTPKEIHSEKKVYVIREPELIGDLPGAIHGFLFNGFIGSLYRRFPFPENPEGFKQKAYGYQNRAIVESLIKKYAEIQTIRITSSLVQNHISIGEYTFNTKNFRAVILYLWQGGMPKWKDENRPDYIIKMMRAVKSSKNKVINADFDHS